MNLVDYIHTVFCMNGGIICFLTKVTDIVNTVVACGINFNNVKYRTVVNTLAYFTLIAWIAVVGIRTVDRLGKYLCASWK